MPNELRAFLTGLDSNAAWRLMDWLCDNADNDLVGELMRCIVSTKPNLKRKIEDGAAPYA